MKTKSLPLCVGLVGLLSLLALPVAHGQTVYEDDFVTNPGNLNGRTTASGFGNWVTSDNALQTGGGLLTVSTNSPVDYHAATFGLPTLQSGQILNLSVSVLPSGGGFLGIGFTESAGQYLINSGFSWMFLEGVGSVSPGGVQIFRGIGAQDNVYTGTPAGFSASLATTYTFSYDFSAKTIALSALNGTTTFEFFSALDVAGLPASAFSNFALQFQGQNLASDSLPAYVDSIRVEVVPEPSVNLLLALGAVVLGVTTIRRSRAKALAA
jgi:hypothetical protein